MQNIDKPSPFYNLLYTLLKGYFHLFYPRVTISGRNNIPENQAIIFAPNHQNSLMDALAILFAANRAVVFLARADIFRKPRIARILYFLRILPVYRTRDGVDTKESNDEIFKRTVKLLHSGTPLAMMPEGVHSPIKRLQPLKKGICRIAFMAATATHFDRELLIVPVGLDYTNRDHAGTHLLINFGKPIRVSDYYALYRENQQQAIVQLRNDLAEAMKTEMIHVEQEAYYQTILSAARFALGRYLREENIKPGRLHNFRALQHILNHLNQAIEVDALNPGHLQEAVSTYQRMLGHEKMHDEVLAKKAVAWPMLIIKAIIAVLLLPLQLYGMVTNAVPYWLPQYFSGKAKDPQFISSINYVLSFVLFPIWYLVVFAGLMLTPLPVGIIPGLLLSFPLTGLFSFYQYKAVKRWRNQLRLKLLMIKKPGAYNALTEQRNQIVKLVFESGLLASKK
ncbi:MAG: 1-acyl-sn-glycerol-3-phosphate acyltransferase [Bacteroidetes bacterium]|nr:1-acyl-sn-glycerol-3-phosphate acyltransferase [Bacteroidota bacterium]